MTNVKNKIILIKILTKYKIITSATKIKLTFSCDEYMMLCYLMSASDYLSWGIPYATFFYSYFYKVEKNFKNKNICRLFNLKYIIIII